MPANGIYNDTIINMSEATNSIQKCLEEMEKITKIKIENIYVLFDPVETQCTSLSKFKIIGGAKISYDDIVI